MAIAGVVLGHWLAYTIAIPEQRLRVEVLTQSGHGYWVLAVKVAMVVGLTSLGTVLLRHFNWRARGETSHTEPVFLLAARLAVLQVLAFTAIEVTERLAAGSPVGSLFSHHLFLFGVALQLLVACVGAVVLLWFARAADRICELVLSVWRRRIGAARLAEPTRRVLLPAGPLRGAAGLRGPPSPHF